jgi:GNAT superfamily N-acetyltransferase
VEVIIRHGLEPDLAQTLMLINELAIYEKAPNEVTNTLEKMREDGFGKNPIFGFFVAEINDTIVGISLFYTRYSTWKGKCLYLEDIIVTEQQRGKGIGHLLFEKTKAFATENDFVSLNWQVLDWNETAINFYKNNHAEFDSEWVNCKIALKKE